MTATTAAVEPKEGMQDAAQDPASTATVSIDDKASCAQWAKALGVTTEALESAVLVVGPRVDRIKDYLTAGMARHQSGG